MKKCIILLFLMASLNSFAQDLNYVRKTLNTLTSKEFWGRGYTKNGMAKAADFVESQFKSFGLQPMDGKNFKQAFIFSVNTFPGKMDVSINGKKLVPGKDFIVQQASVGATAKTDLVQQDTVNFLAASSRIVVTLEEKLTWSVSQKVNDYTQIFVKKSSLSEIPKHIDVTIENTFIPDFRAANICGIVKGTTKPDSVILITAHYDHLGGMGNDTYFPGANDNGSGISFLLSLAKYYAKNPQKYSIAFICFAGEEAGILGSKYFTENSLIPLSNIRFLINVDMVGTGETGATVVNATQYPKEFKLLNEVNDNGKFLVKINPRGKAANSDHYFFTEKGVPAFFLYTQGGITAYHDVFDKAETLPFTVYENLFKLFVGFNKSLMN
ncbi:MAG: M28 family peptidase [Pedobacter sp.]|nr:MAG: M28 family peptidase [Pedobacter sp.]